MLATSYYFYMSWNAYLIFLIIFTTLVDYSVGRVLQQAGTPSRRKAILIIGLVTNMGVLSVFKNVHFFLATVNWISAAFGANTPCGVNLLLPVDSGNLQFFNARQE